MKIALIDPNNLVYTAQSALEIAMGGAESANSLLARELAQQGHQVYLYGQSETAWSLAGVTGLPRQALNAEHLEAQSFDLLIELSGPEVLPALRSELDKLSKGPACILWVHRSWQDTNLRQQDWGRLQQLYDRCVFVSVQQERSFVRRFDLNPDWHQVIPNGLNPLVAELFKDQAELSQSKAFEGSGLRLIYAAGPHKGLELIPYVYKPFQRTYPQASLEVYSSSRELYQSEKEDPGLLKALPGLQALGVNCQGMLAPPDYALALKKSHILLYPGYLHEDTCALVVLEAMAAGCLVIASNKGALTETAGVFGMFSPYQQAEELQKQFLQQMLKAAKAIQNGGQDYLDFCWRQRRYICSRHDWERVAQDWQELFRQLRPQAGNSDNS